MKTTLRQLLAFVAFVLASALPGPASAQVAYTLQHSIPAPPTARVQRDANFGYSVAVEGGFTAVGAPNADTSALNSGVVQVFDTNTGALLYELASPGPATGDYFGESVAISGTRVVVGAPGGFDALQIGSAYVYDLSGVTPLVPVARLNHSGPGSGYRFGSVVAISGTRVVVGAASDDTGASNAGSAYVYDLSSAAPAVPVATLNNPGPAAGDLFGLSVAISGTSVVVGAYSDDTGASGAGSAYVYDLSSATPTVPVRTLNNPGPEAGDGFGFRVAISGTRVVVGALYGASDGIAYVYDLSGATPTVPVRTLNNPEPGPVAGDRFGSFVAVSGTRVVVSAIGDNFNAGSAYVYDLSSGTPTVPVVTLHNPNPAADDNFGWSVAISGTRVVAGAPYDSTLATGAGSAYVYDLSSATPTVPVATLNNLNPAVGGDNFGNSVAISGTRVVATASGSSAAYVYDLTSGTPTVPVFTLNSPSPVVGGDNFGNSVAISGTRVVVGADGDDTGASDAGSAYVYDLSSATPTVPIATLNNPGPAANDTFGFSVAISGTRIVVGAGDDTGATNAGSAYVYDLSSATPTVPIATLNNPSPAVQDRFGNSVAISGTRIVVGAPSDDTGASGAGSAYVYDLSSGTPTVPVATLNNPGPAVNDTFGISVAISGTRVVVGAYNDDTGAGDAGSVYVYDLSSATPRIPIATLNNPGPADGDFFGISVAIFGTRVVVGAHGDDTGATDAGSTYIYDLSSATPTVPVTTINNPGPAEGDKFGSAVAIDGAAVAIGAPSDDTVFTDKGFAYVFTSDADSDGLLDGWEIAHFGTTTGHSALDDTDGDGRNELLEEAFGTNPLAPDAAAAPLPVNEGGYLTMTVAKHPGVNWEVQSAGTLLPALSHSFSPATTTVLSDLTTTLKVRDNVLIGTALARFMRTKVTAAP